MAPRIMPSLTQNTHGLPVLKKISVLAEPNRSVERSIGHGRRKSISCRSTGSLQQRIRELEQTAAQQQALIAQQQETIAHQATVITQQQEAIAGYQDQLTKGCRATAVLQAGDAAGSRGRRPPFAPAWAAGGRIPRSAGPSPPETGRPPPCRQPIGGFSTESSRRPASVIISGA